MKGTVIVSGGTKGLGRAISIAFGRAGYFVLAFYANDDSTAREFETELAREGGTGLALRMDVTAVDPSVWERYEICEAERLVFIHNACASFSPGPMHQLGWDEFERHFNVLIKGGWLCSQGLIRLMLRRRNGTIVNILTSALADTPKGFSAYITAKHALHGFTLALAAEYGSRGLRVLSASPGFMETSLTDRWDGRLREAIRMASEHRTDPAMAAERILGLVEDDTIPALGEDYRI